jgi:hypothetical protein
VLAAEKMTGVQAGGGQVLLVVAEAAAAGGLARGGAAGVRQVDGTAAQPGGEGGDGPAAVLAGADRGQGRGGHGQVGRPGRQAGHHLNRTKKNN